MWKCHVTDQPIKMMHFTVCHLRDIDIIDSWTIRVCFKCKQRKQFTISHMLKSVKISQVQYQSFFNEYISGNWLTVQINMYINYIFQGTFSGNQHHFCPCRSLVISQWNNWKFLILGPDCQLNHNTPLINRQWSLRTTTPQWNLIFCQNHFPHWPLCIQNHHIRYCFLCNSINLTLHYQSKATS